MKHMINKQLTTIFPPKKKKNHSFLFNPVKHYVDNLFDEEAQDALCSCSWLLSH